MPSVGFGIERLGLVAVRRPVATLLLVLVATLAALAGASRVETGGTLVDLFRSRTPEFQAYEAFRDSFPASDRDVLIIVEADGLFQRKRLEAVLALHMELLFAEPVSDVISIFSVPAAPAADGYLPPLLPDRLPAGAALRQLRAEALAHPLIEGRFLSRASSGREATLLIVSLTEEASERARNTVSIRAVEDLTRAALADSGLSYHLVGAPVMAKEIRVSGRRDRVVFNGLALAVGVLACLVFFRRLAPVLVVAACPVTALTWSLGLVGWSGVELNALMNAVLPLVLTLTICDAMHMVYAHRRRLAAGDAPRKAAQRALRSVGPACVLTSLTTALALLSLLIADSAVIERFALFAASAVLVGLAAVLLLVPALGVLLLRSPAAADPRIATGLEGTSHRLCDWLAAVVPPHAGKVTLLGIVLLAVAMALHLQLRPGFQLSAQLPDAFRAEIEAVIASSGLDLTHPLQVVVRARQQPADAEEAGRLVGRVHRLLERHRDVHGVWSRELLVRWLEREGTLAPSELEGYLAEIPDHLRSRFLSDDGGASLVTGYIPDLDAGATLRLIDEIEAGLKPLRAAHPGFELSLTGLPALSATNSTRIAHQLNTGLLVAIMLVCALLGVAFFSLWLPVLSLLPNVLPLVMTGAALAAMGRGLDYASLVAMTVAFGVAVDNCIHFFNRMYLERRPERSPKEAVAMAIRGVGPVLIAATLVLMLGISATIFSELPLTRLFGTLCMSILAAALVADLAFLPALLVFCSRWRLLPRAFTVAP